MLPARVVRHMLSLTIHELDSRIAHCLWTRQPFRHFKVEASITKDGGGEMPDVSYDILVPADAIFNLSGDVWNPACKRVVAGVIYDSWQTVNDPGLISTGRGGLQMNLGAGSAHMLMAGAGTGLIAYNLTVNLKADLHSLDLRWRVLQHGEPISEGTDYFDFEQFAMPEG